MLRLTPLLRGPPRKLVLAPPALIRACMLLAMHDPLLGVGVRAKAYAAAQMALCLGIVVPVLLDYRRVRPLHAVLALVARARAGLRRVLAAGGAAWVRLVAFEEDVPAGV